MLYTTNCRRLCKRCCCSKHHILGHLVFVPNSVSQQNCATLLLEAETSDSYTANFEKLPIYFPNNSVGPDTIKANSNILLPALDATKLLEIIMPFLMLDVLIFATRTDVNYDSRSIDETAASVATKPFSQTKDVAVLDGVSENLLAMQRHLIPLQLLSNLTRWRALIRDLAQQADTRSAPSLQLSQIFGDPNSPSQHAFIFEMRGLAMHQDQERKGERQKTYANITAAASLFTLFVAVCSSVYPAFPTDTYTAVG